MHYDYHDNLFSVVISQMHVLRDISTSHLKLHEVYKASKLLWNLSFINFTMRNLSSSLVLWIEIILVSISWFGGHAYPSDALIVNPDHILGIESSVELDQDDSLLHQQKLLEHSTKSTPIYNARHPTKREVSIPVKNSNTITLKLIGIRFDR